MMHIMAKLDKLSPQEISAIIKYDPLSGALTWNYRAPDTFQSNRKGTPGNWNARFAGKPALTAASNGYRVGNIGGRMYRAHHVAWAIANGKWPSDHIDHINGDRSDNRIENLRIVSPSDNNMNMRLRSDNKSGVPGVYYIADRNKWRAEIRVRGKLISLGYYVEKKDAIDARKRGEHDHGFHKNHGRITTS